MAKIAIASCYYIGNYGSVLQAFVTQNYLESQGHEVVTIDISGLHKILNRRKIRYFAREITDFSVVADKAGRIKKIIRRKLNRSYSRKLREREIKMDAFRKQGFKLSPRFSSFEQLRDYVRQMDAVIVGSDQLWLPSNIEADFFTLNFVPDEVKKIAFATSFGISALPAEFADKANSFLRRFAYLSVREQTGAQIIARVTGVKVPVVSDPVMLLSRDEWDREIRDKRLCKEKYIFCYFLGSIKQHRNFACSVRNATGYKIIAFLYCDQYVRDDQHYADETPFDVGPSEFLNYIRHAEIVLTDSFHASMLSIIYEKEFRVFLRHKETDSLSTNSRIFGMMQDFHLMDYVLTGYEDAEDAFKQPIHYTDVRKQLTALHDKSVQFLHDALV